MMLRLALALLLAALAGPAGAQTLRVATWNLNWFTLRSAEQADLPEGVRTRRPDDIARLAAYADRLAPDVAALEEVDGPQAAAALFPAERYALHFTADHVTQRVGLAIRKGIAFTPNPDLTALDPYPTARYPLRSGADVTLHLARGPLRILAVHLKSGCQRQALGGRDRACEVLREQIPVLARWAAQRQAEGEAFLILGDFNRVMEGDDPMLRALQAAAPLAQATAGLGSPCWGGGSFIDQIFAGGPARSWMQPASLAVMVYRERGSQWRDRLSDHCPLSVTLAP